MKIRKINNELDYKLWSGFQLALTSQMMKCLSGSLHNFSLTLASSRFHVPPYAQGCKNTNGNIEIELISNSYLNPRLNDWEVALIKNLGWKLPTSSKPNFWIEIPLDSDLEDYAALILVSFQNVFGMAPNSWLTFGTSKDDLYVSQNEAFWHHIDSEYFICLPGKNFSSTTEGVRLALHN